MKRQGICFIPLTACSGDLWLIHSIVPWLCQERFPTRSISIGRSSFLSGLSVCLTLLTGTLIHHLPSLCPVDLVQCQQEKLLMQIFISLFMKSVALNKKYGARRKKEKQLEYSEISLQRFSKRFPNKWQCILSWYFPLFWVWQRKDKMKCTPHWIISM